MGRGNLFGIFDIIQVVSALHESFHRHTTQSKLMFDLNQPLGNKLEVLLRVAMERNSLCRNPVRAAVEIGRSEDCIHGLERLEVEMKRVDVLLQFLDDLRGNYVRSRGRWGDGGMIE